MEAPLAERIRPQKLEDYISQLHLAVPRESEDKFHFEQNQNQSGLLTKKQTIAIPQKKVVVQ